MYYIFLETLGKILFNEADSKHHDHHQEGQDDQECHPSTRRFLMIIFPIKTPCVIYFRKACAISGSMKMAPPIMITIRKVIMIMNFLQVQKGFAQLSPTAAAAKMRLGWH